MLVQFYWVMEPQSSVRYCKFQSSFLEESHAPMATEIHRISLFFKLSSVRWRKVMRFLLLTFYFWSLWNSWFKNFLHSPFSYLTGLGSLEKKVCGGLGIKSGPMCCLLPVADHACMPGTKGPLRYYVFKGEPLFPIFPFLSSHPLGTSKKFFSLNSFYQIVLILQVSFYLIQIIFLEWT